MTRVLKFTRSKVHGLGLLSAMMLCGTAAVASPASTRMLFTGVNISGGEFDNPKPGTTTIYGQNYTFPTAAELDYFASKGVNVIRFPFHWADLQHAINEPLDQAAVGRVRNVVKLAADRGQIVLFDPHDYARYYDKIIGTPEVPDSAFADFWGKLAGEFKDSPNVWFGLMNEPHDLPAAQWLGSANAAIAAIRKSGATNLILVPGIAWTGAHSWVSSGNGATMLGIKDPRNHFVFEVHQYLDTDNSGSHKETVSATIGSERLREFTEWCRTNHKRAFLGEFGAADNPTSAAAVDNMLSYMEKNRDIWVGYTWWAAGAWWGDYMYTVEPKNGVDRPQMAWLRPHMQVNPVTKLSAITAPKPSAPPQTIFRHSRPLRPHQKRS